MNLSRRAAYHAATPYELWQQEEGLPIARGHSVEDLRALALGPWKRKGVAGAFVNLVGSGRTCDAYVCEIPPQRQTTAERYLFEELIYVLQGRGATTVWHEGGAKRTFEWQEGSLFSPPLNSWRQHFNAQGGEPARFVALTDAPQMINRFRNLDFIFNNPFAFSDRFSGEKEYFSGQGREIGEYRTWESNFIPDIPSFKLRDRTLRGQGATGIRLHLAANTMSAHIEEYPVGTYPRGHRHGPGAHILILGGEGYSLFWEEGKEKIRIDWRPGSLFVPPANWFHQHFNPSPEPARYLALKPWGFTYKVEDLSKTDQDIKSGGTQIEYRDQDPEIHALFVEECRKRGTTVKIQI
jgi:oxalate decarboxylase/phosphoglucose isomerase-like protein (cupin superfamily)